MRSRTTSTSAPRVVNEGQAVAFDEARSSDDARQARERGVEALEVAHLEDTALRARDAHQLAGLGRAGG
jgi:hypothetical protein